jgi:predicted nucleic acid-binding protein
MSYLIDRDICMAFLRNVRRVVNRFVQHRSELHLSVMTIMSLEMWLLRVRTPVRHATGYQALLQNVTIVDVNDPIAHRAAVIGNRLQGLQPGLNTTQLVLAATALEQQLSLVTRSTARYANIAGLIVVDWMAP